MPKDLAQEKMRSAHFDPQKKSGNKMKKVQFMLRTFPRVGIPIFGAKTWPQQWVPSLDTIHILVRGPFSVPTFGAKCWDPEMGTTFIKKVGLSLKNFRV